MVRAASETHFGAKPCSLNTIGGIAGTRRAFEPRTKEQGQREVAAPGGGASRPGEPSGSKCRASQDRPAAKDALCRRWRVC